MLPSSCTFPALSYALTCRKYLRPLTHATFELIHVAQLLPPFNAAVQLAPAWSKLLLLREYHPPVSIWIAYSTVVTGISAAAKLSAAVPEMLGRLTSTALFVGLVIATVGVVTSI